MPGKEKIVITICFDGTAYGVSQLPKKDLIKSNLITYLSHAIKGHMIYCAGPGSSNSYGTPGGNGYSILISNGDSKTTLSSTISKSISGPSFMDLWSYIVPGILYGYGQDMNVDLCLQGLAKILTGQRINHERDDVTINMVSWSRGGIAALKLAHKLEKKLPGFKINMILLDPMAGRFDKIPENLTEVGNNVDNIIVVKATDDKRVYFLPLNITRRNKNGVDYIDMPGSHSSVANDDTSTELSSLIGEYMLQETIERLESFGTEFKKEFLPKGLEFLESKEMGVAGIKNECPAMKEKENKINALFAEEQERRKSIEDANKIELLSQNL